MRKVILILIASLLILLPTQAFAKEFSDAKSHWALPSISECTAVGIVEGYPDSTFKPQNSVSHLEALALIIKSMGLEEQAKALDLKKGGYSFPQGVSWGKEYIAMAADKSIINKEKMANLKQDAPTTRVEIAVMCANALHLSGDAAEMSFSDKEEIPESLRSSVAGVVKNGIMVGQPGNKFAPSDKVTRAEIVTMISRLFEKGLINPDPSNYFINEVAGIDKTNQLIALRKSDTVTHPYILADDCVIYRDGKKAELVDFQENDNAKIVLNDKGRVIYLAQFTGQLQANNGTNTDTNTGTNTDTGSNVNNSQSSFSSGSGMIDSIIYGYPIKVIITKSEGGSDLYELESVVKISVNGVTKDTASLVKGSIIEYDYTGNKISEIRVHSASLEETGSQKTDKAYIINLTFDHLTLHFESGLEIGYYIDQNVHFFKDNQQISMSGLKKGDLVEVKRYSNRDELISITIMSGKPRKIFGTIISNVDNCLTVEDYDDVETDYDVGSNVEITNKDGIDLTVTDIDIDDKVEITLTDSGKVDSIVVDEYGSNISGTIITLDTSGDYSLTLERSSGSYKKYEVKDNVKVKEGTKSLDYDDLAEGNEVKLYTNGSNEVTDIVLVDDSRVIKGTVASVDDEGTYGITIKKLDKITSNYEVDDDVTVKENSKSRDFSDLAKGDEVELTIDDDDVVTKIIITEGDSSSVSGVITDFNWDDQEIAIEEDDDENDYDIADDAKITKDGDEIGPEDLLIGAEVELEIEDGEVVEIIIEDDEDIETSGEITKVYSDAIKIEQSSGNEFKLYFESDASLEDEDGDDMDIDDLDVGTDVELRLRDGKIRSLNEV
ncbi:S-layer domain protein [Desulfofarcimen acetoxidans DSM 771]|uniref:S-layer domain protein n=1 Tax=Desulfofarcimen acetoxidans (strain ATCC 49208 / DSM 771 / KCTC 5769 / VKM B-1644 / 5575) TaxID=485916 RepID=C8VYV7_DESAS|nr:S-layer homology domain-containing protein [Desulfofarcimen acetoxidans]ACV64828.1 S-layer domain protein [Desulfofarcimen acetoxidans DSM 771]